MTNTSYIFVRLFVPTKRFLTINFFAFYVRCSLNFSLNSLSVVFSHLIPPIFLFVLVLNFAEIKRHISIYKQILYPLADISRNNFYKFILHLTPFKVIVLVLHRNCVIFPKKIRYSFKTSP